MSTGHTWDYERQRAAIIASKQFNAQNGSLSPDKIKNLIQTTRKISVKDADKDSKYFTAAKSLKDAQKKAKQEFIEIRKYQEDTNVTFLENVERIFKEVGGSHHEGKGCSNMPVEYNHINHTLTLRINLHGSKNYSTFVYKNIFITQTATDTTHMLWNSNLGEQLIKTTTKLGPPKANGIQEKIKKTPTNTEPEIFNTNLGGFFYNILKYEQEPNLLEEAVMACTEGFKKGAKPSNIGILLVFSVHLFVWRGLNTTNEKKRKPGPWHYPSTMTLTDSWTNSENMHSKRLFFDNGERTRHLDGFYTRYGFTDHTANMKFYSVTQKNIRDMDTPSDSSYPKNAERVRWPKEHQPFDTYDKILFLNADFCYDDIVPFLVAHGCNFEIPSSFTDLTMLQDSYVNLSSSDEEKKRETEEETDEESEEENDQETEEEMDQETEEEMDQETEEENDQESGEEMDQETEEEMDDSIGGQDEPEHAWPRKFTDFSGARTSSEIESEHGDDAMSSDDNNATPRYDSSPATRTDSVESVDLFSL